MDAGLLQLPPLRFLTCGSVDDGKSTLIGRLLHDSRLIPEDTLAALARDSRRHGTTGGEVDLALLVDGLEEERQQGITIDVAYRHFRTSQRGFVVADAPGHEQYTRNMATGASNSDLAVVLIDACRGVLPQTRRHAHICSLLGIRHVVAAVNKMDLAGFAQEAFERAAGDFLRFAAPLGFQTVVPVPISARFGDNVVARSANMRWHRGATLIEHLETAEVGPEGERPFRFPVQWVNRPDADFRGLSGTVASGRVAEGDRVVVAASGRASRVSRIVTADGDLPAAAAGDAVTLVLEGDLDVARGDLLCPPDRRPAVADQFAARVLWMDEEPLLPGRQYLMRMGALWTPCSVTAIKHRIDVDTLDERPARSLDLNAIGFCNLSTARPVPFDPYAENRATGAFILVDRFTDRTAGAGTVAFPLRRAANIHREDALVDKAARVALTGQKPFILWFTGLSGSGKSTVAKLAERRLNRAGRLTYLLDGDNVRHGLNRDLGFTDADRVENIRRVGEVAKMFVDAGLVVLCAFISPFRAERRAVRELVEAGEFLEVFMDTPLAECMRRDPKGLYAKARAGAIPNFTGLDSPYEPPETPEITLRTEGTAPEAQVEALLERLKALGHPI